MKKIGLVGEDPNDTSAIENLLNQKYHSQAKFIKLAKGIKGTQLDTVKLKKQVVSEFNSKKCDFAICIRDLDAFESQTDKVNERLKWFSEIEKSISKSILLLNIWELEALIYADIETFETKYHTKLNFKGNPISIQNPKEKLKAATRNSKNKFHESHCPEIFKKIRIDTVIKNCNGFKNFIADFENHLNPNKP
ncbi:DUF4276 family protein [Pedobacter alpinus]|uniref:DUF4276 family protein n=1 Tax=Pedobacter alpinus TaxID=1590643 RepID=A0ABW5TN80_9SPHI